VTAPIVEDGPGGWAAAVAALRAGGVVAIPTDTVYGICVALDTPGGVERLRAVKRRPSDKGIVLLLGEPDEARWIGLMTPAATVLAKACWPGALTIIVSQRSDLDLPAALTAGTSTIGLRVPDHVTPRTLASAVGPLPTTSANVSGLAEARDAEEIQKQLGDAIDLVLDGGAALGGLASTVVDCVGATPRILREGAISTDRIGAILDAAGLRHDLGGKAPTD